MTAKCNLGKINLELMLQVVSPSFAHDLWERPLEFVGATHIQPCSLAIVAIRAFVSKSLRIH